VRKVSSIDYIGFFVGQIALKVFLPLDAVVFLLLIGHLLYNFQLLFVATRKLLSKDQPIALALVEGGLVIFVYLLRELV
jgi:hypothetical protein